MNAKEKGMKRKNIWLTSYQVEILEEEKERTGESISFLVRHAVNGFVESRKNANRLLEFRAR
jgi:hypothetical protein